MTPIMSIIGFSILILALAGLFYPSCGQIVLKDTSFSLRSTIFRQSDGQKPNWIESNERYSQEQKRARIDYRIKLSDDLNLHEASSEATLRFRGSFVYDSQQQTGISVMDHVCTKTTREEIETTLGLYLPKEVDGIDDHIVGSARLLFFIDHHLSEMKLSSMRSVFIRNLPSLMYEYNYRDEATGTDVLFNIYYSELSRAADKEKAMPIEVSMMTKDARIVIDFWEPEILAANAPKHLRRFESFNERSAVDLFAYKLTAGCSEALREIRENLFESDDASALRQFSFRARVKSYTIIDSMVPEGELFVAYDKGLNSLRVDSLTRGTTSVFSFRLNRAYHIGSGDQQRTTLIGKPDGSFEPIPSIPKSECVVSNIYHPLSAYDEKRYRMGKVLLGSEDFVYMGKGQVHGVNAVIYEANDVSLPFWLDREFAYYDKGERKMRNPVRGLSGMLDCESIDLVAYFDENTDEHRLLMVDINHFDRERTKMFGKMTVLIDDFVWRLDNQSPTGERASELFSLADDCSAGGGQDRYGQVNLLLERLDPLDEADSLLDIVGLRDTSLLACLEHEYRLLPTMIFDLETRVRKLKMHPSVGSGDLTQIQVSFRIASHLEDLTSLEFIGFGSLKSPKKFAEGIMWVQSFGDCYAEAASRGGEVNFGFLHADNLCLLDKVAIEVLRKATVNGQTGNVSRALVSKPDTIELYKIWRKSGRDSFDKNDYYCPESIRELQKIFLTGIDRGIEKVQFVVKSVHLEQFDRRSPFADEKEKENKLEQALEDAKKGGAINGIGLVKDRSSKRVGASDDKHSMTQERCHAACLVDPDCKLYSVCLANLETTCVTSGLDVDSHLKEIIAAGIKEDEANNKVVTVQLPGEQIELKKHPNCKIKLKNYFELFSKTASRLKKVEKKRYYAVEDISRCAEMITMHNIEILREDAKRLPDALSLIASTKDDRPAVDLGELHRKTMKQLHHGFHYFDKSTYQGIVSNSQNFRDFIAKQLKELDGIENLDSIEGFCYLDGEASEEETLALEKIGADKLDLVSVYISCVFYPFKFDLFYEKQHGIQLKASSMSEAEKASYRKFAFGQKDELNDSDFTIMKSFLDRGDSIRVPIADTLEMCANYCFAQRKGPWPACRSFDLVTFESGGVRDTMCWLNSITLKQAFANQRYDLVDDQVPIDSLYSHYEPRQGFAKNEVELSYDVSLLTAASRFHDTIKIQAFGISCIVLLSLVGGLALGLIGATKYMTAKEQRRLQREETLVPSGAAGRVIEFDNQVDSEGNMRVH